VVAVGVVMALLPQLGHLAFNFRLYSVAAQLLLWLAIGLIFAPMAGRLLAPGPASAELRRTPETTAV
jgi:hypothetical protein